MKKSLFGAAMAMVLVLAVTGCGKDKNEVHAAGTSSTASKHIDTAARKKAFETKLTALKQYGLDINRTADSEAEAHYLIEVKDAQKSAQALLMWLNAGNTSHRDRKIFVKLLSNMQHFAMDVDWAKYAENRPQSVFVYFVGSGKEKEPVRSLAQKQALGAYLTYSDKDILKEVAIKDIDSQLTAGKKTTKLSLKGAKAIIDKMPTKQDPASKMHLDFGIFHYQADTSYTTDSNQTAIKTAQFSYGNGSCDVDKSNSYLGEIACHFPSFSFEEKEENQTTTVHSGEWNLQTVSTAKAGKMQSVGSFKIGTIGIKHKGDEKPVTVSLNDLNMEVTAKNIDESLIKTLYALATTPQKDSNQSIQKTMKIMGDMFSHGLSIDYLLSIASIDGKADSAGKGKQFKAEAIREKGTVAFTDTYDFKDLTTIKGITVTDEIKGETLFALKELKFGTQVSKLYNFIPGFMEFAGDLAMHPAQAEPTAEEKQKLAVIGMRMANDGFSLAYSPLSIEGIKIAEAKVDYGKMQLDLDATLAKNSVKLSSPMSAMQLLAFLQADGKLVLNKADLKSMSNSFPPQVMAMVMLYAKYEGDKAVFVLKFEKGHLLVNDKPVM